MALEWWELFLLMIWFLIGLFLHALYEPHYEKINAELNGDAYWLEGGQSAHEHFQSLTVYGHDEL